MSFLIDPPWLYATGVAYGRLMPERTPAARALHTATAGAFLATSISLYLNRPWTRPIWEACRAQDGRDWMLNSGVFHIDHRRAGWRVHAASAALFATYPWWLWLGERTARARASSREGGEGAFSATLNGSGNTARVAEPAAP
ncbi:MAG TPA: hypothetical protein VN672_00985 [Solirubrobacteraceae bacterium]|nr:hypothetical protein [Solirubrobacteraceae bacterium]